MKTYRSARQVQAEIEQVLRRRPTPSGSSPLDEVAEILSRGRNYAWIGIYLIAGASPAPAAGSGGASAIAESKQRTVIPIRLGLHEFGAIEVRGEDGKSLAAEDRVLLKAVAQRLARYLHGPGRYLMRKARETAAESSISAEIRHQPEPERGQERTLAAAGHRR